MACGKYLEGFLSFQLSRLYVLIMNLSPTAADGTKLPCPAGYGAVRVTLTHGIKHELTVLQLLGTASLCALTEIGLSFLSPRLLKKLFPPIVTGPTVALIGISLIESALQNWAGGSGPCQTRPTTGIFVVSSFIAT
jgi:xanthine/uracil permease